MATARGFALLFLLVHGALATPSLEARTIHVSNVAGDDRSRGERTDNSVAGAGPMRTIARALRAAGPGDRIELAATDRPYHEAVSFVGAIHSASEQSPTILKGNGAILDGSGPVPSSAWEHFRGDVFRFHPRRLAYQQLFLDGQPLLRVPVSSADVRIPDLQPLEWCLSGGHIYFRPEAGRTPRTYALNHSVLPIGITLYKVRGVVIVDLTVQGFHVDGIQAHDAREVTIAGVTCRGNGRSGIAVAGASRATITGSLLGNNGVSQLRVEGPLQATVNECELLDNTAPPLLQLDGRLTIDGAALTP
jgi:hypothetical protein